MTETDKTATNTTDQQSETHLDPNKVIGSNEEVNGNASPDSNDNAENEIEETLDKPQKLRIMNRRVPLKQAKSGE